MVRRDRRAWFIGVFWAAQYLPWLFQDRPLFFFYAVPNVLFLALGLGYAVTLLNERVRLRATVAGAILGAGAGLVVGTYAMSSVATATPVWKWVALAIGYLFGAAVGAAVDMWAEKAPGGVPLVRRRGTWVGAVVAAIATVLFAFFAPVWTGVPMDRDHVELRWWQPGWI
jgi:dolichyl-phosphate-mannose--protein O-mannosyl transferase